MKKLILLTFFLISTYSFSQENKKEAFQLFKKARNEYYDDNFKEAAKLFEQTISELGETNIQIQPFYILSLDKNEDWQNLEIEVPKFFKLPNYSSNENYKKILEIQTKLKTRLSYEKNYYLEVKQLNNVSDYKSFLDKYPQSKYATEIKGLLDDLEEEILWERSLLKNSVFSMENYLESSKLKKYVSEAETKISNWDDEAKEKAIKSNTQESYKAYLDKFTQGKYRTIIRDKLNYKKEEDYFNKVKYKITNSSESKLNSLEGYLNHYPSGRYVEEANSLIEEILIRGIYSANDSKYYTELISQIEKYTAKFPNSEKSKEKNKAERHLNKRNSGMLLLSYETNESLGLQLGSLRKRNLGWYLSARATTNIIESTFQRDEVISQSEFESIATEFETVYGSASLGLTLPIAYPLYINAGAGVNFKQYLTIETDIVEQTPFFVEEEKTLEIFPEAGLIIKLGPVLISGSASYIREEIIYKAGLGFTF